MIADGPLSPYSALLTKLLICESWKVTFGKAERRHPQNNIGSGYLQDGPTLATMLPPKNAAYPSPFSLYSE